MWHGLTTRAQALGDAEVHVARPVVLEGHAMIGQAEADIEGVLGRTTYIELLKRCYSLKPGDELSVTKPGGAPTRVLEEVENKFRLLRGYPEFDHYVPADCFLQNSADLLGTLPGIAEAANRFESIFREISSPAVAPAASAPEPAVVGV